MSRKSDSSAKITVSKIAAAAGVSPATVSRVVNQGGIVKEETYQRVIEVMKEFGCPIPEKQAPKPVNSPGKLLLINIPTLANPFFSSVIKGARTAISRYDYSLLIYEGFINSETIDEVIKTIRENKVAGLIAVTNIETSILKKLSSITSVVQCCDYNENVDLPYVSIDNTAAAKHAVTHLIAQGKRRIAIINAPNQHYDCVKYRQQGYLAALQESGIPVDDNLIVQLPDLDSDLAVSIALQLLSLTDPPDAFFAVSDVFATAVLRACHLAGKRVPEEVAVVGFDNLNTSKITVPSLSSVNQPKTQLGFMAADMLVEKLANPGVKSRKVLLEAELIIRESSSL